MARLEKQKKLTKRQKAFVEAMADPNVKSQTDAAIKAGYSEKTARVKASSELTKVNILTEIEQRKKEVAEYNGLTPEFVTGGIIKLALEAEENTVKLGAYKTLGNYLKLENAPNTADERLQQIKQSIQARAEEKGVSYEEELKNYVKYYALPDIKEKLVSELEN